MLAQAAAVQTIHEHRAGAHAGAGAGAGTGAGAGKSRAVAPVPERQGKPEKCAVMKRYVRGAILGEGAYGVVFETFDGRHFGVVLAHVHQNGPQVKAHSEPSRNAKRWKSRHRKQNTPVRRPRRSEQRGERASDP